MPTAVVEEWHTPRLPAALERHPGVHEQPVANSHAYHTPVCKVSPAQGVAESEPVRLSTHFPLLFAAISLAHCKIKQGFAANDYVPVLPAVEFSYLCQSSRLI